MSGYRTSDCVTGPMPCSKPYPLARGGHCSQCHESFTSDWVFEHHRVGAYEPRDQRRCLTPDEMTAKGWVQRSTFWGEPSANAPSHWGRRAKTNEQAEGVLQ